MTEIIKYQAYDGTIFEDKIECIDYEKYAFDMISEITSKIMFVDGSKHKSINCGDLTSRICWLEDWYNCDADEIIVTNDISDSAIAWLCNTLGFYLPSSRGHYRYNFDENKWHRI